MSIRISFLMIVLTLGSAGCAMVHPSGNPATDHVDRLFFGRSIGDSATVSDSSWHVYLNEVVTPRFPHGFTYWKAEGQWQSPAGALVREHSFVLEIVHAVQGIQADREIEKIIAEYKRRFHQDSVLHLTIAGQAWF